MKSLKEQLKRILEISLSYISRSIPETGKMGYIMRLISMIKLKLRVNHVTMLTKRELVLGGIEALKLVKRQSSFTIGSIEFRRKFLREK
mgnify:CR=1 FL=1